MGGIIEHRIFEALLNNRLTVRAVKRQLENLEPPQHRCFRKYGTIDHHMRKMSRLQQLDRTKNSQGAYVYWNPAMCNEN